MISEIIAVSNRTYVDSVAKKDRKKIGQFFTPLEIAIFMANLMEFSGESIRILDAGAGTGMLAGCLCENILSNLDILNIHMDLYEYDPGILGVLKENMEFIKQRMKKANKTLTYRIIEKNFILHNADYWSGREQRADCLLYDVVISNPPYKKISKSSPESMAMIDIVYGQPNIYFLFIAMASKLLKQDGQSIFINPRSFSSGAYFKRFREWFFDNMKLTNLHLFVSRENVFNTESVLQETIIMRTVKTKSPVELIKVTESNSIDDFSNLYRFDVPYEIIINSHDDNKFLFIPTNKEDIDILKTIHAWNKNLIKLGFRLKTGPVVDFRASKFLSDTKQDNTVPLFWANNFNGNKLKLPVAGTRKPQYIVESEESKSLLIENKNYLFLKRFTSKEEKRRLQAAVYLANDFLEYNHIGIENHLNYVTKTSGSINENELCGLFVIFNSSIMDRYFRMLNGSTQVNANEINSISFPDIDDILEFGKAVLENRNFSVESCDEIIGKKFNKQKVLKAI